MRTREDNDERVKISLNLFSLLSKSSHPYEENLGRKTELHFLFFSLPFSPHFENGPWRACSLLLETFSKTSNHIFSTTIPRYHM